MEKEIWKFIKNNRYKISSFGKLISFYYTKDKKRPTPIYLKGMLKEGYILIDLRDGYGNKERIYLHRLVLLTFGDKQGDNYLVRHLDDNKLNNNLSNLAWGKDIDNYNDTVKNGNNHLGEKGGNVKLKNTEVIKIREMFASGKYFQKELSTIFNTTQANISRITLRLSWKHI